MGRYNDSGVRWGSLAACIFFCLPLLIYLIVMWYVGFMWDVNCGQHIKRAADANTVELAAQEMSTAVNYLEEHSQTNGYTTLFQFLWKPPSEDVGFWFTNLKTSRDELRNFVKNHEKDTDMRPKQEQQAVLLLKLRQTLLDHGGEGGERITVPSGIARFPNNVAWCVVGWLLFGIALVVGGFFGVLFGSSVP